MAKKATKKFMDTIVEYQTEYEFKKAYDNWKDLCDSISDKDIISMGRTVKGKRTRKTPPTLYGQLEEHVTPNFIRPESSNTGNDGTFKLLKEIDKFMKDQYKGVLLKAHRPKLLNFKDKLEKFSGESTLNPKRIFFTRPKNYQERRGKRKGQAIGREKMKIYGHFADDYYEAKYKGKEGYQGKAHETWYSYEEDGPQNPPLAQALFGKGNLIKVGLVEIIDLAIKELKKPIDNIEIVPKRPSYLKNITSVRKHVQSLLRNKAMFRKGGKPRLNDMAQSFVGMTFVVGERATGGKRMASPSKIIAFASNVPEPAGKIKTFSLSKKFGASAMASLIKEVIGKKTYRLRWGEYLNLKGLTIPKKETKDDNVEKSWIEYIWR